MADEDETARYTPADIEPRWQAFWAKDDTFRTPESPGDKRLYLLDMFPYPSGNGLHVGHPLGYTATDILARAKRAQGYDVLHPMGFDAFGLPAEQHAVKTGTHPAKKTAENVAVFRAQLKALGFSYDWSREVNTTDPKYVRWTQWIFLELFKRGLAYQSEVRVNWCPALGTVLANEEVIDGRSERGNHPVERRAIRQWVLKITEYADRLLDGLDDVDWPTSTRTMQQEWIGKSQGAEVAFQADTPDGPQPLLVYTTRPDTLFGATFMVLAPEHPMVQTLTTEAQRAAVEAYVEQAKHKSDVDRQKTKTGVFTGGFAENPVTGTKVPVWIADYVLWGYGTGAIMAVPAHDQRDLEFARTYDLPVVEVVSADGTPSGEIETAVADAGIALNSGKYDGQKTEDMKKAIIADLEAAGQGNGRTQYKLRDWIFSRQRYWGEPIPIYFPVTLSEGVTDPRKGEEGVDFVVDYDGAIAVEADALPVELPELDDYRPGEDPRGVLARVQDWRLFERDGQWFARETNTMPQWAGSCWYYLRYCDPHNDQLAWSEEAASRWLPVDLYVGGAEHAVLHLLYARFWHMVLYDAGYIPKHAPEPFAKLVHQGMLLGEVEIYGYEGADGPVALEFVQETDDGVFVDGRDQSPLTRKALSEADVQKKGSALSWKGTDVPVLAKAFKMSKSRGNVINPDDIIREHGADALRVYEMFMGPLEATKPWNTANIAGVSRFLERAWRLASQAEDVPCDDALEKSTHKCIDKVTGDIEHMRFNTAISAMMVLSSELAKQKPPPKSGVSRLAQLLHPFAPHLGEEMWHLLGHEGSIQRAPWPVADPEKLIDSEVEVPVQVNGKKRGVVHLSPDADEATALAAAKEVPNVAELLEGKTLRKTIWVPGRILNLIVG